MVVSRNGDVPLRTKDGGATWQPLTSVGSVHLTQVEYSWTGKTLVYLGTGGTQDASHPHVGYVWTSTDDGDTWTDVTGDIVTASFGALMRVPQTLLHCHAPARGPPLQPICVCASGIAQCFEGTLYLSSSGQGILSKVFESEE